MTPAISVIIPSHNRRAFLKESVQSVLDQTFNNFELIIVDDGSTDGTQAADFDDARIQWIKQSNQGVSAARNAGIQKSRADWLAFLDSDDLWHHDKLEKQLLFHEGHPELSLSQTEEIWMREGVRVRPLKRHQKPHGDFFIPSLKLCLVSPSSVFIHSNVFSQVGHFNENLPVCEDYDLWLRIALHFRIGLIDEALVTKRGGHADQLSTRFWGMDRFRIESMGNILSTNKLSSERQHACLEEIRKKATVYANGCLKRGRKAEGLKYSQLAAKCENEHAAL